MNAVRQGNELLMTSCERLRDELLAFIDGELPDESRRTLEGHLAVCEACRREAMALQDALADIRALPDPPMPDGFWDTFGTTVRRRIAAERRPREPLWHRLTTWLGDVPVLRPVPAVGTALAVGLLLAIGLAHAPRLPDVPNYEVLALGDSLPIAQNLDVLEHLDVVENLDLLEHFNDLRDPGFPRQAGRG